VEEVIGGFASVTCFLRRLAIGALLARGQHEETIMAKIPMTGKIMEQTKAILRKISAHFPVGGNGFMRCCVSSLHQLAKATQGW
jgi:hypothetical protein